MKRNNRKSLKIENLANYDEIQDNLSYWLSRPENERIEAVDILRKETHGDKLRLKRVYKIIKLS